MSELVPPDCPLVWTTLRPLNGDREKLRRALTKLSEDDKGFRVDDEGADGQIVIRAMSKLHVDVICERLVREHNIYVESGRPKIIYLETIRETSTGEGKFITQSGGRGHYAHVVIRIEPNPSKGYKFVDETPEGAITRKYLGPVNQGIQYALKAGAVAGCETTDIKVTLCDGSYHEADSDEAAFESAGFMAMKEAITQANPVLLEPLMSVEVVCPEDLCGSVLSDLSLRRGRIDGMEGRAGKEVIQATVPLAEMMTYAKDLLSITQSAGTYSARFAHYEQAPGLPPAGDDRIGVTANKPWKPKPKHGAEAVEPPWEDS